MQFDYDILMSFVPGGDKGRFLAFERFIHHQMAV